MVAIQTFLQGLDPYNVTLEGKVTPQHAQLAQCTAVCEISTVRHIAKLIGSTWLKAVDTIGNDSK